MSLTRKHYVAIAKVIEMQMVTSFGDTVAMEAIESIAVGLAGTFKADNPRFDSSTFYSAASVRCYTCHGNKWGHFASEGCKAR